MSPKTEPKKTTKKAAGGFTAEEKAAMKARILEERASKDRAAGESAIVAAIAKMREPDRSLAKRVHEIVTAAAPELMPRTWYGMPAYANADGKVICFFQDAGKFKVRYATFGFQHDAHLDDGEMWPTSYALTKLTPSVEAKITALVKKAVS